MSQFRDFLLLVPSSADISPAPMKASDLLDASRKATDTTHPAVLSLLPGNAGPVEIPAISHMSDGDLWVLFFHAAVPSTAADPGANVMGLVLVGHAPENT